MENRKVLSSDQMRFRILIYSALMATIISLLVAAFSIIPLYNRLKKNAWTDLSHIHALENIAAEQYLSRAANIARQITSRTRIRQELSKYNRAEISLSSLVDFTGPKLQDAMRLSSEVLGIIRFDQAGRPVVRVGSVIPQEQWLVHSSKNQSVVFGVPDPLGNAKHLLLSAPILNRESEHVGSDLVLFDLQELESIVFSDTSLLGNTGEILVAIQTASEILPVFSPRRKQDESGYFSEGLAAVLRSTPASETILTRVEDIHGSCDIVATGRMQSTGWILAVRMSEDKLYKNVNRQLYIIFAGIVLLVAAGLLGMVLLLRPLTGRIFIHTRELDQRIEEQAVSLQKKNILIENILRSSTAIAIAATDRHLRIQYFNPEAERIFGYTAEEVLGKTVPELHTVEKVDSSRFDRAINRVKQQGIYRYSVEQQVEEGIRYVDSQVTGIWNQGNLDGFVLMSRDVTEEHAMAAEKKQVQEKLFRAQKMEAIGMMAGGVAHDLNNILSGIICYPELILLDLPPDSPLREPVHNIQESGQRAAAVVDDLLTVARGVASPREPHDINLLIKEYLDSPECKKLKSLHPGVVCGQQLTAGHSIVSCSPMHIKKTVMNLLTNAAEAFGDGGSISILTSNRQVNKSEKLKDDLEPGNYVILTVQDNGPGIADSDLEHIFEPFYTRKAMGQSGTGLGLAIVWNTVQDHNGRIFVESSKEGTCFQLYFPVSKEEGAAQLENIGKTVPTGNGEYILVVDDEPQIRDIASQMLRTLGYMVDSVCSGEMAIDFVKKSPVDLIVIDMMMDPGINGRQTYEKILEMYSDQKAIIASGFSESEDVKATLRLGASGFIKKPYSMGQLGRAVKEALSN